MELILASGNAHKLEEIASKLQDLGLQRITLCGLNAYPDFVMPEETGTTFTENALIKARAVAAISGKAALADDSGLTVDFLDGAPGVYSARYAGPQHDDADNNAKLLQALKCVPEEERGAQFRCVIALVLPDGREYTAEGTVAGRILDAPRGAGGFGYDPLFYVEELARGMAELTQSEKNAISHRGRALEAIAPRLRKLAQ